MNFSANAGFFFLVRVEGGGGGSIRTEHFYGMSLRIILQVRCSEIDFSGFYTARYHISIRKYICMCVWASRPNTWTKKAEIRHVVSK